MKSRTEGLKGTRISKWEMIISINSPMFTIQCANFRLPVVMCGTIGPYAFFFLYTD